MKYVRPLTLLSALLLLCSCSTFDGRQAPADPAALPVGKNWQIVEEPPKLSDERGRLPFQVEQSVQPEGATKSEPPAKNRRIETPL